MRVIISIVIILLSVYGVYEVNTYLEKSKEILRDKHNQQKIVEEPTHPNFNIIKPLNSNQI